MKRKLDKISNELVKEIIDASYKLGKYMQKKYDIKPELTTDDLIEFTDIFYEYQKDINRYCESVDFQTKQLINRYGANVGICINIKKSDNEILPINLKFNCSHNEVREIIAGFNVPEAALENVLDFFMQKKKEYVAELRRKEEEKSK